MPAGRANKENVVKKRKSVVQFMLPIDAEPIDAEPIDAKPIDAKPIDAEPIEPVDAQLVEVDSNCMLPTASDCSQVEPSDAAISVSVPGCVVFVS